jgi:hypothetical protein
MELNMDGAEGERLQASGNVDITVFDFFKASGAFAFEKSDKTVILADETEVSTNLLAVGGNNITAFAPSAGTCIHAAPTFATSSLAPKCVLNCCSAE